MNVVNLMNYFVCWRRNSIWDSDPRQPLPSLQEDKKFKIKKISNIFFLATVAGQHHKAKCSLRLLPPHPRTEVQILLGSQVLQLEIPGGNQVLVVSHVEKLEIPEGRTRGPPHLIGGAPG